MILLEPKNRIIENTLLQRFEAVKAGQKPDPIVTQIADFDGVTYHVSNPNSDRNKIQLSISLRFYRQLEEHGVRQVLVREYGEHLLEQPEQGYSISLLFDLTRLPDDCADLAARAAKLRRNCFAAVFEKYFDFQAKGELGHERATIRYRDDESMYVDAQHDRVTVIFSTVFKDANDIVIGKIFLQEFKEGRKASATAPVVLFSSGEAPLELKDTDAAVGDNISYITFILFPRHTSGPARDETIDMICMFKAYLHYHIKCSKAYMHSRMRSKTSEFLKILNRAKPDQKLVTKKTMQGRTFTPL